MNGSGPLINNRMFVFNCANCTCVQNDAFIRGGCFVLIWLTGPLGKRIVFTKTGHCNAFEVCHIVDNGDLLAI